MGLKGGEEVIGKGSGAGLMEADLNRVIHPLDFIRRPVAFLSHVRQAGTVN